MSAYLPSPGGRGVNVTALARTPGDRGPPERPQNRGRVEPWRAQLLERRIRPPAHREVGPLEQAEARIVEEALQGPEIGAGRNERQAGLVEGGARRHPATGTTTSSPGRRRSVRASRACSPSVRPCRIGTVEPADGVM